MSCQPSSILYSSFTIYYVYGKSLKKILKNTFPQMKMSDEAN